jgi:hypothetical protein
MPSQDSTLLLLQVRGCPVVMLWQVRRAAWVQVKVVAAVEAVVDETMHDLHHQDLESTATRYPHSSSFFLCWFRSCPPSCPGAGGRRWI